MKRINFFCFNARFLLILMGLSASAAIGQSGPCGVGNSLENQVWLNATSLDFPDGTAVVNWTDISGNNNNFIQNSSARQPMYNESGINSIPSLTFDGVNDVLISGSIPALESAELTYFVVYNRTTTTSDMLITADYASHENKWRTYMNNGQNTIISAQYSPTIKWVRYTDPPGASFLSSHITTVGISTYNLGDLQMTRSVGYTTPSGHNQIFLGNRNGAEVSNYTFTGEIAEVIIYNCSLNNLERVLIENYLGNKYNMSIPQDYYSHSETHRFGLIGLANDGVNSQTSAQGAGVLLLSDASELDANEYFMVAHTNAALALFNTTDLPVILPEHQRFERTWRAGEVGEVGETRLTFDLDEFDFASGDSYRLLVDTDGTFADATILTGTYDAATSSVSFDVNLSDGTYFTIAGIQENLEIHSVASGTWNSESTWDCLCIPGNNDNVYIRPSTSVDIDAPAAVNNLVIETSGTLDMTTPVTLNLKGDLEISGNLNCTDGTISISGSEAQRIIIAPDSSVPAILHDVLMLNTSSENVEFENGNFELYGTLSPQLGNLVILPSATFTVKSSSATTRGRVGSIIAPATVAGNFHVERHLPAGAADWRNLSCPVIGSTFDTWDPDLAMSGPDFPDGCASGPEDLCFKSVRYTDHSISYNVLSSSDSIENGRGYDVFVGSGLETFDGTTLTSVGRLNTGSEIFCTLTTGWHTIGNPYASPIAYSSVDKSSSISKYFYVYDSNTGTYQWYDELSGTSSVPEITGAGLIAIGQGVWVFATSTGNINYKQADKINIDATFIRRPEFAGNTLKIQLSENASDYSCTVEFEEYDNASDYFDPLIDILHLTTGKEAGPSFAIASNDELLRKNFVRPNGETKTFKLSTAFKATGSYTISALNQGNFRNYCQILLKDLATGETADLKAGDYHFSAMESETNETRFELTLSNQKEIENQFDTMTPELEIEQISHQININITAPEGKMASVRVANILGQEAAYESQLMLSENINQVILPPHLKGLHLVTVYCEDKMVSKKVLL